MAEENKNAGAAVIDFTDVKDGGSRFNKKRLPAGDYRAKIAKVEDAPSKRDNAPQWLFTITIDDDGSVRYPYYCKLVENQLWKVRNLCVAAGMNVPKRKVKLDPNKLVGKAIAVTLEDDEYEGKLQSVIAATFPVSELSPLERADADDDDDEDEVDTAPAAADDDDDEEEAPAPKKKKKKAVEVDEDDLDELDIDI
jgi:hypothetical protein